MVLTSINDPNNRVQAAQVEWELPVNNNGCKDICDGIYKNWEDLVNRTASYWEKVENNSFEAWVKSGLFRSLGIDVDKFNNNDFSHSAINSLSLRFCHSCKDFFSWVSQYFFGSW